MLYAITFESTQTETRNREEMLQKERDDARELALVVDATSRWEALKKALEKMHQRNLRGYKIKDVRELDIENIMGV